MFAKPFKTKSCNNLKGSARKTLVQKIQSVYKHLTEDDLKELVPLKSSLSLMKLTTNVDEEVTLHIVDNVPIMMELQDAFYPTVYGMWRCPKMIPTLTIYDNVSSRFQDGVYHVTRGHLYLPTKGFRLPSFRKGSAVAVNMTNNSAAVLVGIANYSTEDLPIVQRGQCVKTLQMFGDLLSRHEKLVKLPMPQMGAPYVTPEETNTLREDLSNMVITSENDDVKNDNILDVDTSEDIKAIDTPDTGDITPEASKSDANGFPLDMDDLLKYCLLSFIKTEGKKIHLPIKCNLLYANHMSTFAPSDRPLDVKKSSYKKFGKFLEAMEKEGILQVKLIEKGTDGVVSVDLSHPAVKEHEILPNVVSNGDASEGSTNGGTFTAPSVKEMFKVTAAVLPFFEPLGFKRGQPVTPAEITNCIGHYVRRNDLQVKDNPSLVKIDPILGQLCSAPESISWEVLKSAVQKKMTQCTEMTFSDGSSTINTGKLPIITMQVANRSGNKKVTVVSNLHYYGISLTALSKECQHGVAASCTITKCPGSKFDQLQVQGNQTYFLAKHLTEFYKLPKRFIEGADKILAKKKK